MQERLIGAAVLVVLGVWLIPWVLDGPPQTEVGDARETLELPVPVLDAEPLRRETIELDAARRAATGRVAAPPAEPPAAARTDAEPGASETVAANATTSPARSEPQARAPSATAAPAAPAPAPRNAAPAADTWAVQLGSFGDEANARRLADRVKAFGHDAQIVPFSAGARTMYRVRIGSFATRRQAEATASSLSAHGFPAQIVAPE